MSDEQDKLRASLEPPRLFGRKKKPRSQGEAKPAAAARPGSDETAPQPEPEPLPESASADEPVVEEHLTDAAPVPVSAAEPAPGAEPAPEPEQTAAVTEPAAPAYEQAADLAADGSAPEPTPVTAEAPVEQAAVLDDVPPSQEPAVERTEILPFTAEDDTALAGGAPSDDEVAPREASAASRFAGRLRDRWAPSAQGPDQVEVEVEPEPVTGAETEDAEILARGTAYTGPMLAAYPAAALTGGIVGLAMVVLTWLSLRGCEAIRGTATCGGGPGLLLLLATFIVSVMLGNAILKSFQVPDPGSSSFLAVGLVAVVSLLLLIDTLDSWVMLVVIPVISIAAYLLSVYVTKTFVEPADR